MRSQGAIAPLVMIVAAVMAGCAPQSAVTLSDVLSNPDLKYFTNPQDESAELCADVEGCVEGWSTAEAKFLRFADVDSATQFTLDAGSDLFQSHQLVVDFRDSDVTPQERQGITQVIEGAHQDT